jgi:hypothetical protein
MAGLGPATHDFPLILQRRGGRPEARHDTGGRVGINGAWYQTRTSRCDLSAARSAALTIGQSFRR